MRARSRILVAVVACLAIRTASIASADPLPTGIAADRFVPAPGGGSFIGSFLGIEGAGPPARYSLTASLSGAGRLFSVENRITGELVTRPVDRALTLDVAGEVALGSRFSVGLGMPVALYLQGDRLSALGDDATLSAPVIGDIRLRARVLLYGLRGGPVRLAAAVVGTVPGGGEAQFAGTSSPTIEPRLMAEYDAKLSRAIVRLGLLAGARIARERQFLDARFGTDAHLGIAIDVAANRSDWRGRVHGIAEVESSVLDRWLEARGALRIAGHLLSVDIGAGAGLLSAPGNPALRLFLLLRHDG